MVEHILWRLAWQKSKIRGTKWNRHRLPSYPASDSDSDDDVDDGSLVDPHDSDSDTDSTIFFNKGQSSDTKFLTYDDSIYGLDLEDDLTIASDNSDSDDDNNQLQQSFGNGPSRRAERYARRHGNNDSETPMTDVVIRELRRLDTYFNPIMANMAH